MHVVHDTQEEAKTKPQLDGETGLDWGVALITFSLAVHHDMS